MPSVVCAPSRGEVHGVPSGEGGLPCLEHAHGPEGKQGGMQTGREADQGKEVRKVRRVYLVIGNPLP